MTYTSTINPSYTYKHYSYTSGVTAPQWKNNNIISFGTQNTDTPPLSGTDLKIKHIQEEFKMAKDEQGCVGKSWDFIKNIFNTKYSSDNIEKAVNSLNSDSSDEEIENVRNMITQYRHKQDLAVDNIGTIGSTVAGGTAGAKAGGMLGAAIGSIIPGAGTIFGGITGTLLGFAGGAILGIAAKVSISQLENVTDNIDNNAFHNDKNLGKEALLGAIAGVNAMLFDGIADKISGVCKKAFGLTKNGLAMSVGGSANIVKTVSLNAVAEGVGGAAASIAICDSEYLMECTLEEDTEFSWGDLAQTTGISAVTGGLISAGFGATTGYKDAKNFNKFSETTLKSTETSLIKISEHISKKSYDTKEYLEFVDTSLINLIYECSFYRIESIFGKWFKKSLKNVTAIHGEKAFNTKKENS